MPAPHEERGAWCHRAQERARDAAASLDNVAEADGERDYLTGFQCY